ncbi:DUF1513 domain-containing protein [Thalassolituus sp. LLYu03]|uniref:DUF1513 domain-containing protein n=1 Tax=Thalassolituus sp. LLYu03 TaxID=3421656 RepID=UPI003D2A29EE
MMREKSTTLHSRRRFLRQSVLTAGLPLVWSPLAFSGQALSAKTGAGQAPAHEAWVSAQGDGQDHYALSWITPDGQSARVASALSGFRGHGAAQHPLKPGVVVMFSRSPGTEGVEVDLARGEITHRFQSADGHHMHGHGCFSADGRVLYTTESDYRDGTGKIVLRDSQDYRPLGEFLSHGTGPHDIQLMPDQKTLVVANGGLRTRPESGAQVLNPDTMRSTLTYLDAASGRLLSEHTLSESKASIRHLDVARDGTVVVATQLQRQAMSDNHLVALGAVHKPGQELMLLNGPLSLIERFNDYMGSVVLNEHERIAGFTSPRGNIAAFWHIDSGELAGYHAFFDVCGLTTSLDERWFVLSNSAGEVRQLNARTLKEDKSLRRDYDGMHWDNHMLAIHLNDATV